MSRVPVTLFLAVAILAVYAAELGGVVDPLAAGFVPAAPTFQGAAMGLLLHDPTNLWHLIGNLVFLVVFGTIVEHAIGSAGFVTLFAAAGLGGEALHYVVDPASTDALVGCSGSLFGLMALGAVLQPRFLGFVLIFAAINVFYAFAGGAGTTSFGAHLGGFVVGFVVVAFMRLTSSEALEAA